MFYGCELNGNGGAAILNNKQNNCKSQTQIQYKKTE